MSFILEALHHVALIGKDRIIRVVDVVPPEELLTQYGSTLVSLGKGDEAIQILQGLAPKYEDHHKVDFTTAAIEAAVKLSDRYITDRFLPDKAIDVMDEAGSRARISTMTRPPEMKTLELDIEDLKQKKEQAIKAQDFEGAATMRDKEKQAKDKLEKVLAEWRANREEKRVKVDEEDILNVISKWTGIPLKRMERDEAQRDENQDRRRQGSSSCREAREVCQRMADRTPVPDVLGESEPVARLLRRLGRSAELVEEICPRGASLREMR